MIGIKWSNFVIHKRSNTGEVHTYQ